MSAGFPNDIRLRFRKLPLTMERHGRDILLAGFFLLLMLICAVGYWSERSVQDVEANLIAAQDVNARHLRTVLQIDEVSGEMNSEVGVVIGGAGQGALHFTAMQTLKGLKGQMDGLLAAGRASTLGQLPEFKSVEESFDAYWQAVTSEDPLGQRWDEKRAQLQRAIHDLVALVRDERAASDEQAATTSHLARRSIILTTGAVLGVGLLVTLLTFLELRRILNRLSRAGRQSAEARDYLKSLLDSLVSGVIVIADDGLVTMVNRPLIEQAGLTTRDPVGRHYQEVLEGHESLRQMVAERLESGIPNHRYCGRVGMAEKKLFDIFASPLSVGQQQRGLILVFVDVTEIERAQMELVRNRTLLAVGQMTAQVAHEIKNPLGSINLAVDLLRRRSVDKSEDELEIVSVIQRSIGHLGRIVGELLEFSRPKELNLSRVNINKLLEDLLPMAADRSAAKQIVFETEFSDAVPPAEYDEAELRKLFLNLIINAIDASDPGRTVTLRTRVESTGELAVDVQDHGHGMDDETKRRLFEPFYTTKTNGTGLGMAIAKKITELHRGDLTVSSRKGEGATITVRLPLNGAGAATSGRVVA